MAQSRTRRAATEAAEDSRRRRRRAVISTGIAMILIVFLSGWVGWLIRGATTSKHAVTVSSTFHGTLTLVSSGSPTKVCIRPDGGANQICSYAYTESAVHTGDQVYAAHEWVHTGGGNSHDLLLIYPLNPPS